MPYNINSLLCPQECVTVPVWCMHIHNVAYRRLRHDVSRVALQ